MKTSTFLKSYLAVCLLFSMLIGFSPVRAADSSLDINSSDFRLVVCDGPTIPDNLKAEIIPSNSAAFREKYGHNPPYVPCDFRGIMLTVRHVLNILLVAGVLGAFVMLLYSGFLYIKGDPKDREKLTDTLLKLVKGFALMLCAWFIVYQILTWLTSNPGLTSLIEL